MDHDRNPCPSSQLKRRKVDRACDACRRRKTKCDGPRMPECICSNCRQAQKPCTYLEGSKPRGPPKAYVTGLESRMRKLEALLIQLRPEADLVSEVGPPVIPGSWNRTEPSTSEQLEPQNPYTFQPAHPDGRPSQITHAKFESYLYPPEVSAQSGGSADSDNETASSYDEASDSDLVESLTGAAQKLTLGNKEANTVRPSDNISRFHGRSSPIGLVGATRRLKQMHQARNPKDHPPLHQMASDDVTGSRNPQTRRSGFWSTPEWENSWEGIHMDSQELLSSILAGFPPEDLALELMGFYFLHVNTHFPLLHRPTFYQQWQRKLYHTDVWFACLCVSIFAVGSRWTTDPRVFKNRAESTTGESEWSVADWQYIDIALSIHRSRRSLFYSASLFEIQCHCVLGIFLRGTTRHAAGWILYGLGIRKAEDVGAHRRKVYNSDPSLEDELWKRALWCMVVMERMGSVILGRACCVAEEDIDIDMPLEVDDEYWITDDPATAFKQPAGKPAQVSAFNQLIKLSHIVSLALKSMYTVNETSVFPGLIRPSNGLEQLKKALSDWIEGLPEHLAWSDRTLSSSFASLAATLHTAYHLVQIAIHRPFLTISASDPLRQARLSPVSALDICVDAARSCVRTAEAQIHYNLSKGPFALHAAQYSTGILLTKVWGLKTREKVMRGQGSKDVQPSMQLVQPLLDDVNFLVRVLEMAEPRWPFVSTILKDIRQSLPSQSESTGGLPQTLGNPPITSPPGPLGSLHTPAWEWNTPFDMTNALNHAHTLPPPINTRHLGPPVPTHAVPITYSDPRRGTAIYGEEYISRGGRTVSSAHSAPDLSQENRRDRERARIVSSVSSSTLPVDPQTGDLWAEHFNRRPSLPVIFVSMEGNQNRRQDCPTRKPSLQEGQGQGQGQGNVGYNRGTMNFEGYDFPKSSYSQGPPTLPPPAYPYERSNFRWNEQPDNPNANMQPSAHMAWGERQNMEHDYGPSPKYFEHGRYNPN